MARHRRSVALSLEATANVNYISERKGMSANRAIEIAIESYWRVMEMEGREGGTITGLVVRANDGREQRVYLL
jgi:hypothetical protein